MIILTANTMPQIYRSFMTRIRSRSPRGSAQIIGVVVDVAVDAVVDAKVTTRSGSRTNIIKIGIEMNMEMVFKRGSVRVCTIAFVNGVDGILPTPLDFMLLKNVILGILACHTTMTTGRFQGVFMVLQLILDPLRKAERAPHIKSIWLFLK